MINFALPSKRDIKYLKLSLDSLVNSVSTIPNIKYYVVVVCPEDQVKSKRKLLKEYNDEWDALTDSDCFMNDKISWTKMINKAWKHIPTKYGVYWSDDVLINRDCFPLLYRMLRKNRGAGAVAAAWTRDLRLKKFGIYGSNSSNQPITINYGLINLTILKSVGWFKEEAKFYDGDLQISRTLQKNGRKVLLSRESKVVDFNGTENAMKKMFDKIAKLK